MRVFRCLYMLLGLVFCVFQAWCERICGTEFTDAGSSAYLADSVLEGEVTVMWDPNSAGVYNVSLKVPRRKTYKVYKDSSGSVQRVLEKSRGVINVGEFGTENKVRCVTDIVRNTRYMFFLRATESPEYFRISAFPLSTSGSKKASKKIRRLLNSIVCSKCAKAPRINKRLKSISVEAGKKITLKCGASGNPRPRIRWERNGKVLRRAKGMRIKTGKRGSRLQYRKASKKAHGEYKCIAENVVKRVEKKVQITVTQKPVVPTAPRFEACHKKYNGHCLNNGTCLYSPELKEKFCRCSKEFSGKRCEYREFFTVYGPIETKAKLDHERTLIVIGIVIAILVFIVICILSYYLAKQKRTSFYKRREERKREVVNEPYKPLLRDEVDSMPIRIKKKHSMTTQTEESVFALIESGRLTSEGQPIQPVTANHIFANFPNSSPVHMRDKPVTTNAQLPLRDRLNAVSVEVEDSARNELDEPDTPEVPPQPTDKGPSGENPGDSASSHSSSSLPTEPTFPVPTQSPASDNSTTNGDFPDPPPEAHTQGQEGDAPSSDEEDIEAALLSKHPELRVHLHISEEDLSNRNKSVSLESPDNRKSPDEQEPSTDLKPVVPGEGVQVSNPGVHSGVADQLRQPGVNCNGFPVSEGLYDESSSEDSSNTSSSSESLVDPGSLPAILSLENPHTKQPDNHVSWDEHGTPVISQYACNPYAMDLDDDFVNSQLYEPANFRLFGNLESPPPPPVEDKLRNVREDQDPVPL